MTGFDWPTFLRRWNDELLASPDADELPPDVRQSGYLGFPPATDAQIAATERRLQIPLPPSYKAFLQASNGWHRISHAIGRVWGVDKIDWFRKLDPDWVSVYTREPTKPRAYGDPEPIPDDIYFTYTLPELFFREEHLPETLQISAKGDAAVILLNPQVINQDGEWEAWFFASWNPGAHRFRSFRELMENDYHYFSTGNFNQPKGLLGPLPAQYIGSPGSPTRRLKPTVLSTDGPSVAELLAALNDGPRALELFPNAALLGPDGHPDQRRSESEARHRVVEALGRRKDPSAAGPLIHLLATTNNRRLRQWTIESLGQIGGPDATEALFAILDDEADAHAIHALKTLAPDRLKPVLLRMLEGDRVSIALPVVTHVLAELNEPRALPYLARAVTAATPDNLHAPQLAATCMAAFGPAGLDALSQLLAHDNPHVRRTAAHGILKTHRAEAMDILRPLLQHPDPALREIAELGLKILPRHPAN